MVFEYAKQCHTVIALSANKRVIQIWNITRYLGLL